MRRFASIVLAGGLLAGASLGAFAAEEGGGPERHGAMHHGEKGKGLGLSDEQKDKLRAIREDAQDAVDPLRLKERKALRALRKELRTKAAGPEIEATLADLKAARKAIREEREKSMEKAAAVLTPEQRARMALRMARRARGRWGMMERREGRDKGR